MTTITTGTNTGVVLTSPSYVNPILINPGVTISNYGSACFGDHRMLDNPE